MAFLKNCTTEPIEKKKEIEKLDINGEMEISGEDQLRLVGNVYGSGEFPDGMRLQTSPITSIRRYDVDSYTALTMAGKEYGFGFVRHYGMPALNRWYLVDEYAGLFVERAKSYEVDLYRYGRVDICGNVVDVEGYKDGSAFKLENITSFKPAKEFGGVIAMTSDKKSYLLPNEERIGFYDYFSYIYDWHLVFDKPKRKDFEAWKRLKGTVDEMMYFSRKRTVAADLYERQEMDVPRDLKMRFVSKKKKTEVVDKLVSIAHMGKVKTYAVCDSKCDPVFEYDIWSMDNRQKKFLKRLEAMAF